MTVLYETESQTDALTFEANPIININTCVNKYAQRHYNRALIHAEEGNWKIAVQELRDAIKLEPNNSDYHALLGVIYLKQKLTGMARVYIRQALKINPENSLALKYADFLKISSRTTINPASLAKALGIAALLSRLPQKNKSY